MPEFASIASLPHVRDMGGEINISEKNPGRITWDFELPSFLDTERMVINMTQLRRIQKVADFTLNGVLDFQGDTAQYDATIVGIGSDSTAVMGKTKKVRKAQEDKNIIYSPIKDHVMYEHYGTIAVHTFNKPQLADEVIEMRNRRTVSSEEAWSEVLDHHLNAGVRRVAAQHLIKRTVDGTEQTRTISNIFKGIDASLVAWATSSIAASIATDNPESAVLPAAVLAFTRFANIAHEELKMKNQYGETLFADRRWSLFSDWQPDRYLATIALTRINSLISVKK